MKTVYTRRIKAGLVTAMAAVLTLGAICESHGDVVIRRGRYYGPGDYRVYHGPRYYGRYRRAYPYARGVWVPGHWRWRNGTRIWVAGYWR